MFPASPPVAPSFVLLLKLGGQCHDLVVVLLGVQCRPFDRHRLAGD